MLFFCNYLVEVKSQTASL